MKQTKYDAMTGTWHCHQSKLTSHGMDYILLLISSGFIVQIAFIKHFLLQIMKMIYLYQVSLILYLILKQPHLNVQFFIEITSSFKSEENMLTYNHQQPNQIYQSNRFVTIRTTQLEMGFWQWINRFPVSCYNYLSGKRQLPCDCNCNPTKLWCLTSHCVGFSYSNCSTHRSSGQLKCKSL